MAVETTTKHRMDIPAAVTRTLNDNTSAVAVYNVGDSGDERIGETARTVVTITAETITLASAASTNGTFKIANAPILNSLNDSIGSLGDSSFSFVTGTCLDNEVAYNNGITDAAQYALMSDGDYAIDYYSGKLRYQTKTAAASDTANYDIAVLKLSTDIEIGAVEIKDGDSDNRANVNDANTARTTATHVLGVQHIDETGAVLASADTAANAGFQKMTDGTNIAAVDPANTARTTATVVQSTQHVDATGKVQPAGDLVGNPVNVVLGDGTTQATVETAGTKKALDVNITDGTNDMPTGDALGRSIFVNVGDGTTTAVVETDGTKKALNVNITDGTNDQPTMDAVARRGFVGLTDGTNDAAIDPANTARTTATVVQAIQNVGADGTVQPTGSLNTNAPFAQITDGTSDLTLGTGTVKTIPSEIHDGTTGVDVIATINSLKSDVSSVAGTVTDVNNGSVSAGTQRVTIADDSTGQTQITDGTTQVDVIAGTTALKTDTSSVAGTATNVNGGNRDAGTQTVTLADDDPLVTSSASILSNTVSLPHATHRSPYDFTAAYTSNVTITLTGISVTDSSQVKYIMYIPTGGSGAAVLSNGLNGVTITESANVLTVNGAGTPFAASDVYEVGINMQDKAQDASLDVKKVIEQAKDSDNDTSFVEYLASTTLDNDTAYNELGEQSTDGYASINLAIVKTASDADKTKIKVIYLRETGSATDYQETELRDSGSGLTDVVTHEYLLPVAAFTGELNIPTLGYPYMRIDYGKYTNTGTQPDLEIYINKSVLKVRG